MKSESPLKKRTQEDQGNPLYLEAFLRAKSRLSPYLTRTPLMSVQDTLKGNDPLFLKVEALQKGGSFKLRGAMNHVLQRAPEGRDLCTYSSGNHGIAVALAAQILQRKATVFTPQDVTPLKAERLRELGANVIKAGTTSVERLQACLEHQRLSGDHVVPAFDDLEVITGQGTIALELMEDLEHIDNLLVPVGGGGLISGIASCLHWTRPNVKVFACEPEAAPTCFESFHHQKRITLSLGDTIADGLKPTTLGEHTFPRILDHVHDCLTVSELEIFNAMKDLFQRHKLVVEPSGAVPLACYFAHQERFANKNTVVILSGGNLSLAQLAQWGQRFERSGAP